MVVKGSKRCESSKFRRYEDVSTEDMDITVRFAKIQEMAEVELNFANKCQKWNL